MRKLSHVVFMLCTVLCLATSLEAADSSIHGVIADSAGKPLRGAIVKATAGNLSISGYSQNDGRYEISVPAGTYDISVDAYGFGPKRLSKDA
jgi:hypothetical protein